MHIACRAVMGILTLIAFVVLLLPHLAAAGGAPVTPNTANWAPCGDAFPGCELAVVQGDPSKGPSDLFVRVPRSSVFPKHWHTSAERIVGVSGQMLINVEGGESFYLTPGMYFYLPGRAVHSARCDVPCVIFIGLDQPMDITLVK